MSRATTLFAVLALIGTTHAHDGPPYPILVDEPFADRTLSVWADPDVGVGTFYLYFDAEPGDLDHLALWVRPSDGRLPEVRHAAVLAEPGAPYQFVVEAKFDARGDWDTRLTFDAPERASELRVTVEVTPPGLGRIDVLWFLAPFLMVAFLWAKALHQRVRHSRTVPTPASPSS